MIISLIAALGANRVIGDHNRLPWNLPADLKHFKEITSGHPIIMGRKTYDSIGRPLPQRRNMVITRQADLVIPGCEVVSSLEDALRLVQEEQEVFIIGGAQIFEQALPLANRMYLTLIEKDFPGDAHFPSYEAAQWRVTEEKKFPADAENPFEYSFVTLERLTS
ncbi:MAG: dihydrofolate reductase [Patescibacteria group bacterium]